MSQTSESDRIVIRPARPDEGPTLSALAFRSKAYWGYDASFMTACVKELTISQEALGSNPAYVIEEAGCIFGFYTLVRLNEEEVDLGHLFVEPEKIGQGYGGRLMRHAKAMAAALGYRAMIIQGDPHAEPFYRAMGGEWIGRKPSESIPGRDLPLFRIELERSSA